MNVSEQSVFNCYFVWTSVSELSIFNACTSVAWAHTINGKTNQFILCDFGLSPVSPGRITQGSENFPLFVLFGSGWPCGLNPANLSLWLSHTQGRSFWKVNFAEHEPPFICS